MIRPWMKFYPSDWRSDPKLRMCSLAARGLWIEMLSIMHEAEPYGHLVVGGVAVGPDALAKMAGIGLKECRNLLASLRQVGVYSETETGIIYSRRMERDHVKALKDKENGSKGGNPTLGQGVNPPDKAQKPEARYQRPEEALVEPLEPHSEKPEPDIPADASRSARAGRSYFFEAGIIRLTEPDFRRWERDFPNVNLAGELRGLAGWATEEGRSGRNWFFAVPGALAKRDREARLAVERIKAEAIAAASAPGRKKPVYLGP